jgi:hypothetical protein
MSNSGSAYSECISLSTVSSSESDEMEGESANKRVGINYISTEFN